MSLDLIIVGGRVLTGQMHKKADVGVRRGKVAALGRIPTRERHLARQVLDAKGCLVMPGGVDPHVHLELPIGSGMRTSDDFESGSRAAAAGGMTTLIDYTTPLAGQPPLEAFQRRRQQADGRIHVDYGLHNVLIGWRPEWKSQLAGLVRQGAPSVKLFMIYADRGWQADDGMLFEVMKACQPLGVTVCVHAENDALISYFLRRARTLPASERPAALGLALSRPPIVEEEAAARAIRLAQATGCKLHLVHLSTAAAARAVQAARMEGARQISAETCPQYLALDQKKLAGVSGHLWGCCPPLRDKTNRQGLLGALQQGWLQAIGTDHCAFTSAQKNAWQGDFERIPYGLPGVETALAVTHSLGPVVNQLTCRQWVYLHTEGPARVFGLYPRKGSLDIGADADVVVWDPRKRWRVAWDRLQTACDWNPYQGQTLTGRARDVLLRGRFLVRDGSVLENPPAGQFVKRTRYRP